jgi:hypothetical protein
LEEENKYLIQVIKDQALVKNAQLYSVSISEKSQTKMGQSLSEDNLLASFRKISKEIKEYNQDVQSESKDMHDEKEIEGTLASNNVTLDEISPIDENHEDAPKTVNIEEFDILGRVKN